MTDKKIIMYESPEAATLQTVTGWVAANGQFWGNDERMARFCGSTHRLCNVNPAHPVHETNGYCHACRDERIKAEWDAMPRRVWDEIEPVVIYDTDRYFFDAESLRDYLFDNSIEIDDAQLVFCVPNKAQQIDPNEHFCDDLYEDGEVSAELAAAFEVLNEVIKREQPLSWSPGKERAVLPADFLLKDI